MVSGGPDSEAVYVAVILALDDEIQARAAADPGFVYQRTLPLLQEQLLIQRKMTRPPVSYQKLSRLYIDRLVAIAGRYGLPIRRPSWHAVYRWVTKYYRIEES